jgi:hypothetical protein
MFDSAMNFLRDNILFAILGVTVITAKLFSWMGNSYWTEFNDLIKRKHTFITKSDLEKCRESAFNEIKNMQDDLIKHIDKLDIRAEERINRVHERIDEIIKGKNK